MSATSNDLKLFSDISSYDNYSRISKNLNKIYKNKCFKSFYQSLKGPKATSNANDYYLNVMKLQDKHANRRELVFSTDLIEKMIKKEKRNELEHLMSLKKEYTIVKKFHDQSQDKNNKAMLLMMNQPKQDLSMGKYHPNYEAIYPNNHGVEFSKNTGRNHFKSDLNTPQILPNINNSPTICKHISNSNYNTDDIRKKYNHALRFSKYSWKNKQHKKDDEKDDKDDISSSLHCKTEIFNDTPNVIKSLKGIDYEKMKCPNHDFLNMHKLRENSPTIGMYNPRYDSITKNIPSVVFQIEREKLYNKKFLLKKLWNSYIVENDYRIVKFDNKDYNEMPLIHN